MGFSWIFHAMAVFDDCFAAVLAKAHWLRGTRASALCYLSTLEITGKKSGIYMGYA